MQTPPAQLHCPGSRDGSRESQRRVSRRRGGDFSPGTANEVGPGVGRERPHFYILLSYVPNEYVSRILKNELNLFSKLFS